MAEIVFGPFSLDIGATRLLRDGAEVRLRPQALQALRVLLRHGVAVPVTLNIPLSFIECADLRRFGDRTGDISLRIARGPRIGYVLTWPHLRPGRISRALALPSSRRELSVVP